MKKPRWIAILAGLAFVVAAPAQAQTSLDFEVTPFAGGTFFLGQPPSQFMLHGDGQNGLLLEKAEYDNTFMLGLNLGLVFNERYVVEGMFSWLPTKIGAQAGLEEKADVNGYMYGATFLYYLPLDWRMEPFLGAGIGGESYDYDIQGIETHNHFMGNVVAGLLFPLNEQFGVRFDVRDCFAELGSGVDGVGDKYENDLMVGVGLSYRIGIR